MKNLILGLLAATVLSVSVFASVSQVQITTLGASGDKWGVQLTTANGGFDGYREKSYAVVAPYYESGCNCYHVPLTVMGFTQNQINVAASSTVTHFVPGSGSGCSGGYCPLESLIEILD